MSIAMLINHPPAARFWAGVKQACGDPFAIISSRILREVYDPIDRREDPDPAKYETISLSGGKADPSASDPQILEMLDFVRTTRYTPRTKMLGICWGHQAL